MGKMLLYGKNVIIWEKCYLIIVNILKNYN
jgi:hypothetical protein